MKSNDLGIFLYRSAYSDSSLIAWFYTRENGLQKFLFRGGKKKSNSLFPLSVNELSFYGHKHSELLNLTSAETVIPYTFQYNPVSSSIAFFAVECIKKSVHLGDKDEATFQFLVKFANELEKEKAPAFLPIIFLIELSDILGFKPNFEEESAYNFNLDEGLFQTTFNSHQRIVRGPEIDLISEIINGSIISNTVSKKTREDALNVLLEYFKIHVPRFDTLKSYDIVKEVLND